ncbi:MAG TPA: carbamoyltransferase N-terminal domain-containing protein [Asanoa sp.]|nr:carbamoyltransferase N-terminal domain-containing protein [Asanoa sp.]
MLICGVKVSHDGGVAVVQDGRLLFSVETEKIGNGLRYSTLGDLERIGEILAAHGIPLAEVDQFVFDGWWDEAATGRPSIATRWRGRPQVAPVAGYVHSGRGSTPMDRHVLRVDGFDYSSYYHATGHVMAAYATSPFARRGEDALVLVWDGGITPRLYQVSPRDLAVRPLGSLLPAIGNVFPHLCGPLEPFRIPAAVVAADEPRQRQHLEISGKAMAYAALGTVREDAFGVLDSLIAENPPITDQACVELSEKLTAARTERLPGLTDADLIATLQSYLGTRLLDTLAAFVRRRFPGSPPNLCLGGGCALNIKWNSAIRASGLFADVWVPPFPNDAGAAIGAAACEAFARDRSTALEWNVFQGPMLGGATPSWPARPCSPAGVAEILHGEGEPVVVLDGRAELGPRALGNRSILAPAVSAAMKTRLNEMKGRAAYRPVAPICLASRSAEVFDPGGADPYMLFEHRPRPGWAERIPAVLHLDGTARLQTVDDDADTAAVRILREYERRSGIPVLCNTSANLNGHGFFADAATAAEWGRTRYVWSDGILYTAP